MFLSSPSPSPPLVHWRWSAECLFTAIWCDAMMPGQLSLTHLVADKKLSQDDRMFIRRGHSGSSPRSTDSALHRHLFWNSTSLIPADGHRELRTQFPWLLSGNATNVEPFVGREPGRLWERDLLSWEYEISITNASGNTITTSLQLPTPEENNTSQGVGGNESAYLFIIQIATNAADLFLPVAEMQLNVELSGYQRKSCRLFVVPLRIHFGSFWSVYIERTRPLRVGGRRFLLLRW